MRAHLRNPRLWLGMLISLAAILLAVQGVDWPMLRTALASADYVWLAPAALTVVAGQALRAVRWRALFGDGPRPSLVSTFEILSVGYMVSAVFPLRLGDPVRAWLVDTRSEAGGAGALATVVVERVVDFLMVAALLAVWVPAPAARLLGERLGPGLWSEPANLGVFALVLVAAVYAGLLAASAAGPRAGKVAERALRVLSVSESWARRIGDAVAGFAEGLAPLGRSRTAVMVSVWTLAVWLSGALHYWMIMHAFRLDLPFSAAVLALGTTAVFAVLPSSPGYVGVFHSGIVLALASFAQVPRSTALAYAIVLHGLTIAILIGLGVIATWTIGLTGRELGARLSG